MTKSFLAVIAEAAGLSGNHPLPVRPPPEARSIQPAANLSLPEQIVLSWISDPAIRHEFLTLEAYQAWRTQATAKAAGVPVAHHNAQQPDTAGYLAKLEKANESVSESEKSAIGTFAATWCGSADIRAEFRTFEVYAAYQRAKTSGLVKRYGQGSVR